MRVVKVGTRQSQLALAQTNQIVQLLQEKNPHVSFEIVPFVTKGDRLTHVSLQEIGGKGVFVKEIEAQLLNGTIDLAVHSLKDVPSVLPDACVLGAIPKREDVRDCMLFKDKQMSFDSLPTGARIGTSSLRRQVQLLHKRKDVIIEALRGNIDTRVQKVMAGEYDAIVLAMAGLSRIDTLSLEQLNYELLPVHISIPAVAQGALGLECRKEDAELRQILLTVHDEETARCVDLERYFLSLMNGDCTFPIGAYARLENNVFHFDVMLATEDMETCHQLRYIGQNDKKLAHLAKHDLEQLGCFGMKK
ncbi:MULTISPECIES: hydroxymethylbilane synthase [unclassified Granulicatella]|uniref:hydroxymethylbilane synthase n=1 Tax=unclassified Granulicatella TaxID=2630493 RepID=UPI0010737336|nr:MULTISPECIES: hydroxymethylbilane synthase [unclassified Granulicatella]MBF0779531.1 hydroxymethylbilane synthase [Granulicatella sp. 19428wC4_WM01]TFU96496.1 hydroxymethylbilane synthase [Granulicatella sp. WM01]